jgi:pyruvate-formate lyase-activating enzyme
MSHKYFPIKTSTACQLKWSWSTIRLYVGTTSSCHRVLPHNITVENFDSFHNTPEKLKDRELMLQGQWPNGGCEYCKNIEEAGGTSDRLHHLTIPNMFPKELESNASATVVSPDIVEVYFDNACNMKCVYCWDGFSSQIQVENLKFGRFENHGVIIDNRANMIADKNALTEKFWDWMTQHHKSIKRLHVLGGEPFYQIQFDRCLDFFESNPSPNLEFNVVTNLMISSNKLETIIQHIKKLVVERKLKRFDLTCSIDCFGPEQEYVRYGLDLKQWCKNFEYIANQKWIYLNINQTLSCLTVKTVPALLEYINQLSSTRQINQYFSTTTMTYDFLNPAVFGAGYFDKEFEKILGLMPDQTQQQKTARDCMQSIQTQLNTTKKNKSGIEQLVIFLDEIDRRRKLDWRKTFPWLAQEIAHVV